MPSNSINKFSSACASTFPKQRIAAPQHCKRLGVGCEEQIWKIVHVRSRTTSKLRRRKAHARESHLGSCSGSQRLSLNMYRSPVLKYFMLYAKTTASRFRDGFPHKTKSKSLQPHRKCSPQNYCKQHQAAVIKRLACEAAMLLRQMALPYL